MSYLIAVATTGTLLIGFLLMLLVERRKETRFFERARGNLDARAARYFYIAEHVDWNAFFAHVFKLSLSKIAHDVVHGTLLLVRGIEKFLTRAIRLLREQIRHTHAGETEGFKLKETIRQFRRKR